MTGSVNPPPPPQVQPGMPQQPVGPQPAWPPPAAGVPASTPRGAPRRRSRRLWIVGGVIAAVAAAGVFANMQREQAYTTGHAAYLAADCATAIGPLREAAKSGSSSSDDDTVLKARAEIEECEALLAADDLDTQGKPGEAVLAYSEIVVKYPRSPLKDAALTKGQALISQGPADRVATVDVCTGLDTLEAQRFVSTPAETLPALLLACGNAFEAERAFEDALAMYERFRAEYAEHDLITDVDTAYARATLAAADVSGAGELPDPENVGDSGEAGGLTTIEIRNDSPETMTIVFSGPDVRVEELAACTECRTFIGVGPESCPELGPTGRYVLQPGSYDVVVKSSSDAGVTPFRGTWTLEADQGYSQCFYIVRRTG